MKNIAAMWGFPDDVVGPAFAPARMLPFTSGHVSAFLSRPKLRLNPNPIRSFEVDCTLAVDDAATFGALAPDRDVHISAPEVLCNFNMDVDGAVLVPETISPYTLDNASASGGPRFNPVFGLAPLRSFESDRTSLTVDDAAAFDALTPDRDARMGASEVLRSFNTDVDGAALVPASISPSTLGHASVSPGGLELDSVFGLPPARPFEIDGTSSAAYDVDTFGTLVSNRVDIGDHAASAHSWANASLEQIAPAPVHSWRSPLSTFPISAVHTSLHLKEPQASSSNSTLSGTVGSKTVKSRYTHSLSASSRARTSSSRGSVRSRKPRPKGSNLGDWEEDERNIIKSTGVLAFIKSSERYTIVDKDLAWSCLDDISARHTTRHSSSQPIGIIESMLLL